LKFHEQNFNGIKTSTFKGILDLIELVVNTSANNCSKFEPEEHSLLLPIMFERLGYPNVMFKTKLVELLNNVRQHDLVELKQL